MVRVLFPQKTNMPKAISKQILVIFLFFFSIFIFTTQGSIQTSDGTSMYLVTKNIVENHSLSIDPEGRPGLFKKGKDGKYYSKYGLGTSVLAIPFYYFGRTIGKLLNIPSEFSTKFSVSLMGSLLTALMCVVIFKFTLKLNFPLRKCLILSSIYGLCTMAWAYSEDLYSTTIVNLFLFFAIYLIYDLCEKTPTSLIFYSGLSLGIAILTRYDTLIMVPILLLYLTVKIRKHNDSIKILLRKTFAFIIPLFGSLCVVLVYNYIRFGSLFSSGYTLSNSALFGENILAGLYRLFASTGKSFFIINPILVFSIYGFIKLYQRKKEEGLLFVFVTIGYIIFYSKVDKEFFLGEPLWGPRYLLMILPYCVIVLGFLFSEIKEKKLNKFNFVIKLILGLSFLMQVASVSVNPIRYFYEMKTLYPTDYNEKINFDPRYSLVIGQWKSLYAVLINIGDKSKLQNMISLVKNKKKFLHSTTEEILDDALAINVPNFWWIYAWLYGIPKWIILSSLMFLLAVIFISGKMIFFKHELH